MDNASLPPVPLILRKKNDDTRDNSNYQQRHANYRRNSHHVQERCPFWDKVGACRHGNKCVRLHTRPKKSKTVVFWNLFPNPVRTCYKKTTGKDGTEDVTNNGGDFVVLDAEIDERKLSQEADRFFQDIFVELSLKYGEIDDLIICGNYNPHLGGNVLVKFKDERSAAKSYQECNDRWYGEKPIFCELSPVSYFEDAACKDFSVSGRCDRGDQCNLIHVRRPDYGLRKKLFASQRAYYKDTDR